MKKNIHNNWFDILKSKGLLAVSGGLLMISCGTQLPGYSETDGVYYDPNKDTLPEGIVMNEGNKVGEYYDYQDSTSVIEKSRHNELSKNNRYRNNNWNDDKGTSSDWGSYAGSETNIYNDWGSPFGYGYGFYPRFGYGSYYGMNFGWGNPWYSGFYDWGFGGYYSPWYTGFYGYHPYHYYNPYYGYYNPYGYYGGYYSPYGYGNYYDYPYYYAPRKARGSENGLNANGGRMQQQNSGFRGAENRVMQNPAYTPQNSQPCVRGTQAPRTTFPREVQQPQSEPRYRNDVFRNDGFRSGGGDSGFRSGGFNSGSSGNSSGGGMRSGGGRR